MTLRITSLQNPRIKAAVRLRDRRGREEAGRMLVEGYNELSMALECGVRPAELFLCLDLVRVEEMPLLKRIGALGTEIIEVSSAVMGKLAYRENPDAWLASAPIPRRRLEDLQLGPHPLLIVAESVEKPGNLGAILRSADAAGADAVLVCDRATDVFNPNVVRASKGAVFSVPVVETGSEEALAWLRRKGIRILAATPSARRTHWEEDLTGGIAIAVGTEKEGLSDFWMQGADLAVVIPMAGRVNSLNVAQALTLLIYEAVRQRRLR